LRNRLLTKSPEIILATLLTIVFIAILVPSAAIAEGGPPPKLLWFLAPQIESALVQASDGNVMYPGSAVSLPVTVSNVQQLGATTITLGYDPNVLHPTTCQRNPVFEVGLCNLELDRDGNGEPDAVRFNVVSLEGVDVPADNPLFLVEISWEGVGMPGSGNESVLEVQVETFTDIDALPLDVTAENGLITIIPAVTPSPTPTPTSTATPTPPISSGKTLHLPLLTFAVGGPPPVFQCYGWCLLGSAPGLRRQLVTSDQAISDWRLRVNGQIQNDLLKETPFSALAEAPEGATVYVEALWQGEWRLACKSLVLCRQNAISSCNSYSAPFASLHAKEK